MDIAVLVVDDDNDVRAMLRMLFEGEGYQVFEAPDGKLALERLCGNSDSLVVLLDYYMPRIDGWQVLEAIAQDDDLVQRHAFILGTATFALPLAFVRLLTQLNVPVVFKPFDLDELLTAVQQAVGRLAQVKARKLGG